jgi:predicted small secreted protein
MISTLLEATMNLRAYGKRMCAAVAVAGKKHRNTFVLVALGVCGCHTWQGVKQDTRHAVQETGHGLQKAGKKVEGDDKKPANPPANKGNAGAPSSQR